MLQTQATVAIEGISRSRRWHQRITWSLVIIFLVVCCRHQISTVQAQGTKSAAGGSGDNQQLGATFIKMFNQLTANQQQQFIIQMSPSNKRVIQLTNFQAAPQVVTSTTSEEEIVTKLSSAPSSTGLSQQQQQQPTSFVGGPTKSSTTTTSQRAGKGPAPLSGMLSPARQNQALRSQAQASKTTTTTTTAAIAGQPPTVIVQQQPATSQFSFSRQISTQQQRAPASTFTPQLSEPETSVKGTRIVTNSQQRPAQPQQFSQQIERVHSVQQAPVAVLQPSSELTFKRVQSLASQPLVITQPQQQLQQQQTNIDMGSSSQQFTQQQVQVSQQQQPIQVAIQQQPTVSSSGPFISRFQQQYSQQQVTPAGVTSSETTSNFSGPLQQEKLEFDEINNNALTSADHNQLHSQSQQQQQLDFIQATPVFVGRFESGDAQQKGGQVISGASDDIHSGFTAASINNKWYIMRPVENPSSLGLSVDPGSLLASPSSQLPIGRMLISDQVVLSPAQQQSQPSAAVISAAVKASPASNSSSSSAVTTTITTTTNSSSANLAGSARKSPRSIENNGRERMVTQPSNMSNRNSNNDDDEEDESSVNIEENKAAVR